MVRALPHPYVELFCILRRHVSPFRTVGGSSRATGPRRPPRRAGRAFSGLCEVGASEEAVHRGRRVVERGGPPPKLIRRSHAGTIRPPWQKAENRMKIGGGGATSTTTRRRSFSPPSKSFARKTIACQGPLTICTSVWTWDTARPINRHGEERGGPPPSPDWSQEKMRRPSYGARSL